jgi:ubiquinone/menaquinone biosynthesis C-methylase UbiE
MATQKQSDSCRIQLSEDSDLGDVMAKLYDLFMKPLEDRWLRQIRDRIMPEAHGKVLEIGFGTGVNCQYYQWDKVSHYSTLDLEAHGLDGYVIPSQIEVNHSIGSAEALPFDEGTFDTVVESLVLCSVEHMDQAITEMLRVLKPGGLLIFVDHVSPETPVMKQIFKRIDVLWPHIAGGCHVTRSPQHLIAEKPVQWLVDGRGESSLFKYGIVQKTV